MRTGNVLLIFFGIIITICAGFAAWYYHVLFTFVAICGIVMIVIGGTEEARLSKLNKPSDPYYMHTVTPPEPQFGAPSAHVMYNQPTMAPTFRQPFVAHVETGPASPGLTEFICQTDGVSCTFGSLYEAIGYLLADKDDYFRAMFYAYAVDCSRHGKPIENLARDPNAQRYHDFANAAIQSPEFLRSAHRLCAMDYIEIGSGTNAYKMAAFYFP